MIRLNPEELPDDPPGWIWTVYPASSSEPMISLGHSGRRERAREIVERELATADGSAFGVVIGPGGQHDVCRRGVTGYQWAPLFCAD